jgi:hypothetical protein
LPSIPETPGSLRQKDEIAFRAAYIGSTIGVTGKDDSDGAFPQEKTHLVELL